MSDLDTRGIGADDLPVEPFPDVGYQFRIHVSEDAFDRITSRGEADTSHEIGGVLVGKVCRDDGGPYILVETTIDALHTEEKETELTFTHATWDHIHCEMDARHKDSRIVGWYHTHPGFGVFLSDRDQFIHQSFFNLSYQIALVYDPTSREHGVFAWRENEPMRCRRYWIGSSEHIWDGVRQTQPPVGTSPESEKEQMKTEPESQEVESFQGFDLVTACIFGIALLMGGGILGWWLGQRSSADLVQQAELKIVKAHQLGTEDALRMVNRELLGSLRKVLSSEGVRESLDQGLTAIDEGLASLEDGDTQRSISALSRGQSRLRDLRDNYFRAERALRIVERTSLKTGPSPRDTARILAEQQGAIGMLFQEIANDAEQANDTERAQRLLQAAIKLDPGNSRRYKQRLDNLLGIEQEDEPDEEEVN